MMVPLRLRLLLLFSTVVFLPPLTYVILQLSSMSIGLGLGLLSCVLLANRLIIIRLAGSWILLWGSALALLFFHALIFTFYEISLSKTLSILLVLAMLIGSSSLSAVLEEASNKEIKAFLLFWCAIACVLGFVSPLLDVTILNYSTFEKAVYPFSEPSHYVLSFSGFFLALGLTSNFYRRVILTLILVALALVIESTLLLAVALGFYLLFFARGVRIRQHLILMIVLFSGFIALRGYDFSHFLERVDFAGDNQNLSALVYLQGWQELWLALENTKWVGYGFQNMGTTEPGSYADLIFSIWGDYKHRANGSFLASKIVAEFGIVGIIAVFVYLVFFIKSMLFVINISRPVHRSGRAAKGSSDAAQLLAHSMIIVFFFELFARSVGYFSFGVVALFFSIFLLYTRAAIRIRVFNVGEKNVKSAVSAATHRGGHSVSGAQ